VLALRPTPNLEDQSPEFMSPWGRVARLYPRALVGGSGTSGAPLPVPTMCAPEGNNYNTYNIFLIITFSQISFSKLC
jgi:hypothetical protein